MKAFGQTFLVVAAAWGIPFLVASLFLEVFK